MGETIEEHWDGVEGWLKANAPDLLVGLGEPASEHDISTLEGAFDIQLPADVRASLRRHNGELEELWLFGDFSLLSVDHATNCTSERPSQSKHHARLLDPSYVALAYDGSGRYLWVSCADGHVLETTVYGEDFFVAASWAELMGRYVTRLQAGEFALVEGCLEHDVDKWWRTRSA